jgi:PAS domain S-box-containing protein
MMPNRFADNPLITMIQSAMDAIVLVDHGQHIIFVNAAAEAMFGHNAEDLVGHPLLELLPERFRANHVAHVNSFTSQGTTSRRMGRQRVLYGLRATGAEFPIEAAISRANVDGELVLSVILRDVTETVAAREALEQANAEIKSLSRIAEQAREDEKSRIAREIHDELGQQLTALKIDLQACIGGIDDHQTALRTKLERMRLLLDHTVAETRRIAANLRPLMLDDLGLEPALEWLVQEFRSRHSADIEFLFDPEVRTLPKNMANHIFRIVQEALTNISKHAKATQVAISVVDEGDAIAVMVQDDGQGDKAIKLETNVPGRGLLSIRERAYSMGGTVEMGSADENRGFRLNVRLPHQILGAI